MNSTPWLTNTVILASAKKPISFVNRQRHSSSKSIPDPLRKKLQQIADLHHEILFEQPGFWLGFFNYLVEDRAKMKDSAAADRLIDRGRQFINRGNVGGFAMSLPNCLHSFRAKLLKLGSVVTPAATWA